MPQRRPVRRSEGVVRLPPQILSVVGLVLAAAVAPELTSQLAAGIALIAAGFLGLSHLTGASAGRLEEVGEVFALSVAVAITVP